MRWKTTCLLLAGAALLGAAQPAALRGKLVQADGKPPALETAQHLLVTIEGEPETLAVLDDKRLAGDDVELLGQFKGPDHFAVGPFYTTHSMFVHKDGRKYTVSYWCPVCSIRTYTPGLCVCCRNETNLELEEVK
jgi:hypothetical protein